MIACMSSAGARVLPTGVVTLLFSDIDGSTRLLHTIGEAYGDVLAAHRQLLRVAWQEHDGVELDGEGDAFFVAFTDPERAIQAATAAQRALRSHPWPPGALISVRIGVHTGSPKVRDGRYWGVDVHYAARLCAAAHGGQVLVSSSTATLVKARLEELGEHALKDFPSARPIHHLVIDGRGKDDFSAPRTLRAGRTNLPAQLSSFVGRETELRELPGSLAASRLLTLTGPGGVGKTRLAVQLANRELEAMPAGVWFVDLSTLVDPGLVPLAVAHVLGVSVRTGQDPQEALAEEVADRELLVLVDNCEHVIETASKLIFFLLSRCGRLRVLATSREPLQIPGECVRRVPALSIPRNDEGDPGAIARSAAVTLFVNRAVEQRPGFALDNANAAAISRICRRLTSIPLAIELAAVKLRTRSIFDLDARLDELFALLKRYRRRRSDKARSGR